MNTRNCPRCNHTSDYLAETCDGCGASFATELEIAAFHQPAIDSARKMILLSGLYYPVVVLAAFLLLGQIGGAAVFASKAFLLSLGIGLSLLGAHVALWWWASRQPLPAASLALAVFVGFVAITGDVTEGWIPKVIALAILARAVYAGYRVHLLRRAARSGSSQSMTRSPALGA